MIQQKITLADIIAYMRPMVIGMDKQLSACAEFVLFHTRIFHGEKALLTNLKNFRLKGPAGSGKTNLAYAMACALCEFAGFTGWDKTDIERSKKNYEVALSGTAIQTMTAIKSALDKGNRSVIFADEAHGVNPPTVIQLLKATSCGGIGRVFFRMPNGKGEVTFSHSASDVVYIFASDRDIPSTPLEQRAKSGGFADIPLYSIDERKALFAHFAKRDGLVQLPTDKALEFLMPFTSGTARNIEDTVSLLNSAEKPVRSVGDLAKLLLDKDIYPGGISKDHTDALNFFYFKRKRAVSSRELAPRLKKFAKDGSPDKKAVEKILAEIEVLDADMFLWTPQGRTLGQAGIVYVESNLKKAKAKPPVIVTPIPSKALEIEAKIKALESA